MKTNVLPLKELSIRELFDGTEKCTYEIPIYQRNYAWEKDEITALVQDIYDSFKRNRENNYYIGTLVTFHKGDNIFEIIDGQQRLTTIWLILTVLKQKESNRLTYRARKKSDDTLKYLADPKFNAEEKDSGIENGYRFVSASIKDIPGNEFSDFVSFFMDKVHIIHYQVPKDVDLNRYFEIMNSRGEQLEKHEIVKAKLMEKINATSHFSKDQIESVFNSIWECCSEMSAYVQQNLDDETAEAVFGKSLEQFNLPEFDSLAKEMITAEEKKNNHNAITKKISIDDILKSQGRDTGNLTIYDKEAKESFQPIIDFPNFLLIVLKITRMEEAGFKPDDLILDDKELLREFDEADMNDEKVKKFAFNLLKARFYLDNYVVHHANEDDTIESNPWKLQVWHKGSQTKKWPKNLVGDDDEDNSLQNRLVHLLSMFEVSFTARQRKNYLFYCLYYLLNCETVDEKAYADFVERLADRYFTEVYLDKNKLNANNTPLPGSFDMSILDGNKFIDTQLTHKDFSVFKEIYGDVTEPSKGIPLFVFNYLDFKLWALYDKELSGEKLDERRRERKEFFAKLGCGDFGQKVFKQFYFSRTRRSLEHYYPQANATGKNGALSQEQINCFGNYAMIGSEANSSGSNWTPKTKLDHYLDASGKINQISVASLKFRIMMQVCRNKGKWELEEIKDHQDKMVALLLGE